MGMEPRPEIASWRRFLEAERAGQGEVAERALAALFRALPAPGPGPGFAARVLARIARPSLFARPAVRFGLAASLLAAALGTALLLPMLPGLAALAGPASLLGAGIEGLSFLTVRVASGLAQWLSVADAGLAVGRALRHPQIVSVVLAHFLVALAALRGLAALAFSQRSSRHALLR
jgi:hypothetical protein